MRYRALAVLLLAVAGLLLVTDPASATPSHQPVQIDHHEEYAGADTFLFTITLDTTDSDGENFNIANRSLFKVKGFYPTGGPDGFRQDAAGIIGTVRGDSTLFCPPRRSNNVDPCYMDASGVSIKDATDARVTAGPVTFEQDPDTFAWGSATAAEVWEETRRYEAPIGEDKVTYRFFISIPGAVALDVDLHLHSPNDISIDQTVVHSSGFLATGEDFDAETEVDTMAANAMMGGQETVELETGEHNMYAAFGPSWNGVSSAGPIGFRHNTAAMSSISYTGPGGQTTSGTAYGVGSFSGILVPGSDNPGTHTFEVDRHVGVGPQDVYLVGFKGPNG